MFGNCSKVILGQMGLSRFSRQQIQRSASRRGDDVSIIRIGQGDSLDMRPVAGDGCVRQRVVHELAGDLQALEGNARHAGGQIANPFVVNLIRFARRCSSDCAFRRWRPCIPTHGDQLIRSMTARAAHELDGAVGCRF